MITVLGTKLYQWAMGKASRRIVGRQKRRTQRMRAIRRQRGRRSRS